MLRVGIIGTGGISRAHIDGYLSHPQRCEIVALADPAPGRAAARAAESGLTGARAYESALTMLDAEALDVVSIATPPQSHAELAIAALERGVNVLVEKPMAPSLEQCEAMLAAERASSARLSVVAQNRFRDDVRVLKAVLDSGLLGPVSHLRISSAWWRGLPYYDLWWRGTWAVEGGGCTLNHAIHHVDLLLWLLGRPESVLALLTNAQHENAEVEDLSVALMRYGRAIAELTSSVVHHGEQQEVVIHGRDAMVAQPWAVAADVTTPSGFPQPGGNAELVARIEAIAAAQVPLDRTHHAGQIGDVLDAVESGRAPLVTGEDGKAAVELVTAIYASGIEGRLVPLPLPDADPYRRDGYRADRAPHYYEKTASVAELAGEIIVGSSADKH